MNDQAADLRRAMEGGTAIALPPSASRTLSVRPPKQTSGGNVAAETKRRMGDRDGHGESSVQQRPAPQPVRVNSERGHQPMRLAKAIAVSSGKGGVGKSNLAVNLAVAMSGMGLKVCLLDADMGLANADVLCNITPKVTLEHVVAGKCRLWEAMLLAPGGFRLIPGASGVAKMTEASVDDRRRVLQQLAALERVADVILIDTGAGIGASVITFAAAAHTTIVAITPEPTSLTDGYGMIKTLSGRSGPECRIEIVVNMAASMEEAQHVFTRMDRVSTTFLHRPLHFCGAVPMDGAVPMAVRQRVPFVLLAPDAPATLAVRAISRRLIGLDETPSEAEERSGFFARIARWFGV